MPAARSFSRSRALLFAIVMLVPGLVFAQATTGTIGGTVRDGSGGALPGVTVTATHAGTAEKRIVHSGSDGAYLFPSLPVGVYEISAVLDGFGKGVLQGIELHVSDNLRFNLTLAVGRVMEEVSVVGEAPRVQTATSEQSSLISGDQIRELQLNGRSFMTLLELVPGVASDMPDRVDPNTNPSLSINGARSTASNFNIDGGNNADVMVGSSSLNTFTSIDTIAEVKVVTSTFAAEYGRGGFSQVNVVTKSGTKRFTGSAYEFFRDDKMDARDYLTHQVLPLELNNFGYTLGGPVLLPGGYNKDRSKTFFFFSNEYNNITTRGEAINTIVPTALERDGNFSALGPGADGLFGTSDDPVIDPGTGRGFADGTIPQARRHLDALKLLALYPLPNFRGAGSINFTSAAPSTQNWRQELIRIDHHFSSTWKMYARYVQDHAYIDNPYGGSALTSVTTRFPGVAATRADRPGKNLVVNMTNIIGPSWLNEFGFTYARRIFTMNPVGPDADRAHLGINLAEIFPDNPGNVIPSITLGSGLATLTVPRFSHKRLYNVELSNNVTKLAGRHTLKAGALYSFGFNREHPFSPNLNGSLTFNTSASRNPIANFLLGLPSAYSEVENLVVSRAKFSMFESFVQDDFRVADRLTINAGLRYSAYLNPYDKDDVLTNFLPALYDPARAPQIDTAGRPVAGTGDRLNGIVVAGVNSPYGRRVTNNHTNLFGPRLGFSWDVFGIQKTALRGGYGIFYTRPLLGTFLNNSFGNPPFSRSVSITNPSLDNLAGGTAAPVTVPNLTSLADPLYAPTIEQWSVGVQQTLPLRSTLGVAYVGSRGRHLMRPVSINDAEPAASRTVHINTVRPYLGYGNINQRESTGSSKYHSLQVSLNRRLSGRFSLGLAYTLARSMDDASSDRNDTDIPPDNGSPGAEWGPSDFDRTHVFTGNWIWHLPNGVPGSRHRVLGAVVNGWQLSGIVRAYSGKPFDVVMNQDVAGVASSTNNQRPDVIGDTNGPRTVEQWFNTAAFARPASGTFGNMRRNSLRGPGVNKVDLAIFKNFRPHQRLRVQFRAEAFNAFNTPIFTTVGRALTTTTTGVNPALGNFGVVTGTADARVMQLALKVTF